MVDDVIKFDSIYGSISGRHVLGQKIGRYRDGLSDADRQRYTDKFKSYPGSLIPYFV